MRVSSADIASRRCEDLRNLCSFLSVPEYSRYRKHNELITVVHDFLLTHPRCLPKKVWQWAVAQGKGAFPASELTSQEAADTVEYVEDDELDETMGDAAAASPSQARQILDATVEDKQQSGGGQHQNPYSELLGGAPDTSKIGRKSLESNAEDGDSEGVFSLSKRREQRKAVLKAKANAEHNLQSGKSDKKKAAAQQQIYVTLEQTLGSVWSTLKAVHAAIVKDSANPRLCAQSETVKNAGLVAEALHKMDGVMSGMTASKMETLVKEKQNLHHKKEDGTRIPPQGGQTKSKSWASVVKEGASSPPAAKKPTLQWSST